MGKFYPQYSSKNVSLTKLFHKALASSFNLFTASNSWHSSLRQWKEGSKSRAAVWHNWSRCRFLIIRLETEFQKSDKRALRSAPSWMFTVNFPDLASTWFRIHSVFKNFLSGERIQKVANSYTGYTWYVWTEAESGKKKLGIQKYPDTCELA